MNTNTTEYGRRKVFAANDNTQSLHDLSSVQAYAVRSIARRAGISVSHALLAARLAGIVREARHG